MDPEKDRTLDQPAAGDGGVTGNPLQIASWPAAELEKVQETAGKGQSAEARGVSAGAGTLYSQVAREEVELVSVDESHFHRDLDLGYT